MMANFSKPFCPRLNIIRLKPANWVREVKYKDICIKISKYLQLINKN